MSARTCNNYTTPGGLGGPCLNCGSSQPEHRLTTLEWAEERLSNSERISRTKSGDDRASWLEDLAYWRDIVARLQAQRVYPIADLLSVAEALKKDAAYIRRKPDCGLTAGDAQMSELLSTYLYGYAASLQKTQALREALAALRIDANRLCDRNLGGSYEDDCRSSLKRAEAALGL